MGTRGAYGFYSNGVTKVTYNHFDSYPSNLGVIMLEYCKKFKKEEMVDVFDRFYFVNENEKPSLEEQVRFVEYWDQNVSEGDDWYSLLRNLQGNPFDWHSIKGYIPMSNGESFLQDSLFCEWAYIINFDTDKLEIYKGFQKEPGKGRYQLKEYDERKYHPVSLIAEMDFNSELSVMINLEKDEEE